MFNLFNGHEFLYDGFDAIECCRVELMYGEMSRREVSTALGDDELVRPFPVGGLKAA